MRLLVRISEPDAIAAISRHPANPSPENEKDRLFLFLISDRNQAMLFSIAQREVECLP